MCTYMVAIRQTGTYIAAILLHTLDVKSTKIRGIPSAEGILSVTQGPVTDGRHVEAGLAGNQSRWDGHCEHPFPDCRCLFSRLAKCGLSVVGEPRECTRWDRHVEPVPGRDAQLSGPRTSPSPDGRHQPSLSSCTATDTSVVMRGAVAVTKPTVDHFFMYRSQPLSYACPCATRCGDRCSPCVAWPPVAIGSSLSLTGAPAGASAWPLHLATAEHPPVGASQKKIPTTHTHVRRQVICMTTPGRLGPHCADAANPAAAKPTNGLPSLPCVRVAVLIPRTAVIVSFTLKAASPLSAPSTAQQRSRGRRDCRPPPRLTQSCCEAQRNHGLVVGGISLPVQIAGPPRYTCARFSLAITAQASSTVQADAAERARHGMV